MTMTTDRPGMSRMTKRRLWSSTSLPHSRCMPPGRWKPCICPVRTTSKARRCCQTPLHCTCSPTGCRSPTVSLSAKDMPYRWTLLLLQLRSNISRRRKRCMHRRMCRCIQCGTFQLDSQRMSCSCPSCRHRSCCDSGHQDIQRWRSSCMPESPGILCTCRNCTVSTGLRLVLYSRHCNDNL